MAHGTIDWESVISSDANTLVQGPQAEIQACVTAIVPFSPAPVVMVETASDVLATIGEGSVILKNVACYTLEQQHDLLTWLDACGSVVRLISMSTDRLFDLVECGQFIEVLYYRLNVVLIDFLSSFLLAIVMSLFG